MAKLKIIVGGYIGLYPTGGATWDYIQYVAGLMRLGHEVYYIEDTRLYPVFQSGEKHWNDASGCINYLKGVMSQFGMKGRWAYRDESSGRLFGMGHKALLDHCKSADVFINISCSTFMRDEYYQIPQRILIDSDPMFTQIQFAQEINGELAAQGWSTRDMLEGHNHLFTFGENINAPDCRIPQFDFEWHTTRQPVCLSMWNEQNRSEKYGYTSIMNWAGRSKLYYKGEYWGQKDVEFQKIKNLPARLRRIPLEVVINPPLTQGNDYNEQELARTGWSVYHPASKVPTAKSYRDFILYSHAELGVAKETYVKSRSGWFSGRSACYLAAGKPVIAQETQWSVYIPEGAGLFAFNHVEDVLAAVEEIEADYKWHSAEAVSIARNYFDSDVVLEEMLERVNVIHE